MSDQHPRIGTAVWLRRDAKILLGQRFRGSETGAWSPPGGAIDMFETPTQCALRELSEETGLTAASAKLCSVMSDVFKEKGTHWITMHFVADYLGGEPRDAEGEIGNWRWFAWNELPEPLFSPTRNFAKTGYNPLNFN